VSEPKIESEKARRAARHPDRPGEQCRAEPGKLHPVVDRARCEGKRDCVDVCPYGVFEVRRIDDADFARLSILGRLKSIAHRRQSAYTPHADACRACGLCVVSCPEKAIRLVVSS
jgi:NAD-dependent dihydropyrimidine dehydrogenase PreA subunit